MRRQTSVDSTSQPSKQTDIHLALELYKLLLEMLRLGSRRLGRLLPVGGIELGKIASNSPPTVRAAVPPCPS